MSGRRKMEELAPVGPSWLDDAAIRVWLTDLAHTEDGQRTMLMTLCRHSVGDRMSWPDRHVCVRAGELLGMPIRFTVGGWLAREGDPVQRRARRASRRWDTSGYQGMPIRASWFKEQGYAEPS